MIFSTDDLILGIFSAFAEDNKTSLDSDEEKAEDDEDESWRKARYEREQYLAKLSVRLLYLFFIVFGFW